MKPGPFRLASSLILTASMARFVLAADGLQYDRYGGAEKIVGKANGWFHVERIQERDFLVTPNGHGMFALGVNHIPPKEAERIPSQWKEWGFNTVGYNPPPKLLEAGILRVESFDASETAEPFQWHNSPRVKLEALVGKYATLRPMMGLSYRSPLVERAIYHFRWFWDYSGGQMTNLGQHTLDTVHWIMDLKGPKAVTSCGGRYFLKDNCEVPDTQDVIIEYPGFTAVCQYRECATCGADANMGGLLFCGTHGTMPITRDFYQVLPDKKENPASAVRTMNRSPPPASAQ